MKINRQGDRNLPALTWHLLCFFLLLATTVRAQNNQTGTIKLSALQLRISEIFTQIERQAGVNFMYLKSAPNFSRTIRLRKTQYLLKDVLDEIGEKGEMTFMQDQNQIVAKPKEKTRETTKTVTGRVTDQTTGETLPGVSVQSSSQKVRTDENGNFRIQMEQPGELRFTYLGMESVTREISPAEDRLEVAMVGLSNTLEQVVVTGYQTQKKADLTGAVSVANPSETKDIPLGNPMKSLQGRIPGVYVTTDGSPQGGVTVRIRGIGTVGNNDPLYIIDGVPTKRGLQDVNPRDIASFQVLKDASAATIYGSRAANGVIIITTKRGEQMTSHINVDISTSLQYYPSKQKVLNTMERGQAYWQAAINDGSDPNANQIYQYDWNNDFDHPVLDNIILPAYIDAAQTMRPADTRWFDEISQPSVIQSYNVAFSNGNSRANSLFSVSYYNNKGIVKETNSQRLTTRLNTDYNFLDGKLKVGENLSFNYNKNVLIPTGTILLAALQQPAVVPVHTVEGGWGGPAPGMADRQNPVRLIEDNAQNKEYLYHVLGNAYADYTIIPNLHFRSNVGIDYLGTYQRILNKSYSSGFLSDPSNQVQTSQNYDGNWVWQNTLNYHLEVSKNQVDFLVGQEYIRYLNQSFSAARQGLALENIDYAYLDAGSSNQTNAGIGSSYSLLSYFGKVNYSYSNRYFASVTVRRDGSSRFGSNNRYGIFPAFSLGWRLSEEPFLRNLSFLSDLKLRYGWGKTGNQEIANNATYSLYSAVYGTYQAWSADQGTAYDLSGNGTGQLPSGFRRIQQGNESLKWESTTQSNVGIDFGLFNNQLVGSVDYFIKKTSDILIQPSYLGIMGDGGNQYFNGASMQNKGWELALNYNKRINQDLLLEIGANLATFSNKVTYLPEDVVASYGGNGQDKNILGRPLNSTFGYIADGIFRSQAEVDAYADQPGKGVGRIRYRDLNGDNIVDYQDQDFIANPYPDFTYGLNISVTYKKFDLNLFVQGVQGIDVYNSNKVYTDFASIWPGSNWGERVLSAWTPQNTASTIPALTLVNRNNESRTSTYFIENGSYLKLRNIQVGYNLTGLFGRSGIGQARIYAQASNLLTIKSKQYTAADPENPGNAFPIPVIGTLGVNLTF